MTDEEHAILPRAAAAQRLTPLRYRITRTDLMRLVLSDPASVAYIGLALSLVRAVGKPAIIALSSVASASAAALGLKGSDLWIYVLPFCLVFLVPLGAIKAVLWRWLARAHAPGGFDVEHDLRFDGDGIDYREGPRDSRIAWGAVRGVTVLRHALVLRLSYRPDILIPLRAFPDAARRDAFVRFLRAHCDVTPDVLDRRQDAKLRYFAWEGRARRLRLGLYLGIGLAALIGFVIIVWR